jgi:two-component system, chemotaxis family, protein-glutamate methylesterase/glutaminase
VIAPAPLPVKVLIVDDSASARAMLRSIVETDPLLCVLGAASDAYAAAQMMKSELPDVILLDLEMPGMDGISFLKRIMAQRPIPVVVCSSYTADGSEGSFAAIEAGATDVILKPRNRTDQDRAEARIRICDALRAASMTGGRSSGFAALAAKGRDGKASVDEVLPAPHPLARIPDTDPIVVIGASTGGAEALRKILVALPADAPAIAIVQHMPPGFTAAFARRLDTLCPLRVTEAVEGKILRKGEVVIAPGDHHIMLARGVGGYRVSVTDGPYVSRHRPSVDVLFRSAASAAGRNSMGILLTGMGDDGARCLGELRAAGAVTLAQDEASSVVYGMPREAMRMGSAQHSVALDRMAPEIMAFARRHTAGVRV